MLIKMKTIFLIFLFISSFSFAQEVEIKGIILEEGTKKPVPSVIVSSVFGTNMTRTDSSGKFQIKVKKRDSLLLYHVSYQDTTIKAKYFLTRKRFYLKKKK